MMIYKYTRPLSHCTIVCRKKLERPALLVLGLREYKNHHDLASTNSRYRLKKSCLGMAKFFAPLTVSVKSALAVTEGNLFILWFA